MRSISRTASSKPSKPSLPEHIQAGSTRSSDSNAGSGSWPSGPTRPHLAEGAVHVWRADLETVEDALGELLDAKETARAARLLNPRDRRRWTRARGVLRALLGLYLEVDPSSLCFQTGQHGKPSLIPPAISFNLSHSGAVALYALTPTAAVGVDVEVSLRPTDVLGVAGRVFGASEAERLRALEPVRRRQEFVRAWVQREAELKRTGVGLAGLDERGAGAASWVAALDVGADGAAALALEAQPRELCCWEWPPVARGMS